MAKRKARQALRRECKMLEWGPLLQKGAETLTESPPSHDRANELLCANSRQEIERGAGV